MTNAHSASGKKLYCKACRGGSGPPKQSTTKLDKLYEEEEEEALAHPNPHVNQSAIKANKARKFQTAPAAKKMN